jgi:hypothetical protein
MAAAQQIQRGTPFNEAVALISRLYRRGDTGFAVWQACDDNTGELMTVVGPELGRYEEGDVVRISGTWRPYRDRWQVWVLRVAFLPMFHHEEEEDVADALVSLQRIPHVGLKRAQLLVDRFGEDVFEQIDRAPSRVLQRVARLSVTEAGAAAAWWRSQR